MDADEPRTQPTGRNIAIAHLEKLAAELETQRFSVRLDSPVGGSPRLHVINLAAPILAEDVIASPGADGEWSFWFSWAERIAPVPDVADAAMRIVQVLAEVGRSSDGC